MVGIVRVLGVEARYQYVGTDKMGELYKDADRVVFLLLLM